ncbi:MAG: hypothetical protein C4534_11000 [Gaiellales bacterium]|nr:MAG: hypothetical protein C4534_11000 [Gaiellales bacterium]
MGIAASGQTAPAGDKYEAPEATCDTCFFGASSLCSLPRTQICPTFRSGAGFRPAGERAETGVRRGSGL